MTVMLATLIELEAIQEELPVFPSAKEVYFLMTFGDLKQTIDDNLRKI